MPDPFDLYLASALAPPERDPDALFVARVRALCALDDRLRRRRRALVRAVLVQALGLAAVGGGLAWLGQAASLADFAAASPGVALAALVAGFALLVAVMAVPQGDAA